MRESVWSPSYVVGGVARHSKATTALEAGWQLAKTIFNR